MIASRGRIPFALAFGLVLFGQEPVRYVTEKLSSGYRFTEGPAWSKEGFLIFSDTVNDQLLKWIPGRPAEVLRQHAGGPSGNAFDAEGRLYTCETRARRVTRTDKKGAVEVLAERWDGKRLNAPAGVAVSKSGHVYFTDPAFGYQQDHRELDFYGVYHISPKGDLQLIAKPTGRPNGIAFSPNGHTLYVANSDEHNVRAYDVDRGGEVSHERVVISGVEGVPDGIRVDDKGNIYVTATGVAVYDAQGKHVETIGMPETPANCAFGDTDLETLYITARTSLYRLRRSVKGALQY